MNVGLKSRTNFSSLHVRHAIVPAHRIAFELMTLYYLANATVFGPTNYQPCRFLSLLDLPPLFKSRS
jgi:hypothetical protein